MDLALKRQSTHNPRIIVVGNTTLSRLVHSIIPEYKAVAEIQIIDSTLDEGIESAKELIKNGMADVFLSAGAFGAYLRDKFLLPVVLIKVTPYDLLTSILKARAISDRIVTITYQPSISAHEIEDVKKLLQFNFEHSFYSTVEEARDNFRKLAGENHKVFVGSTLIADMAEHAGHAGICVYSPNSIRHAIEDSILFSRTTQTITTLREQFNSILEHIKEGLIAVDSDERVQFINPIAQAMLGIPTARVLGSVLADIAPQLSLKQTLKTGEAELGRILRIGRKAVLSNRAPIIERGIQTGAVLSFQDPTSIQQADRIIRSRHDPLNKTAKYQLTQVIGTSKAILQAKLLASHYAKTNSTILITGESGTGKELFAQGIHNSSQRNNRPFVAVNCASIPESLLESELFGYEEGAFTGSRRGGKAGLFEAAHTGTIFLDEIGALPIALQTRFLRILQEREVMRLGCLDPIKIDVRVIAATNSDLQSKIREGKFREDLFYRLNILHLQLPALRKRREDIPAFTTHLLKEAMKRLGCDRPVDMLIDTALPFFMRYAWPGNVREMENVVERLAVYYLNMDKSDIGNNELLSSIVPELFDRPKPDHATDTGIRTLKYQRDENELAHIHLVIQECGGNLANAAKRLAISRSTLWRKLHGR